MANLSIDEKDVGLIRLDSAEGPQSHPAAQAFAKGSYVTLDSAGRLAPGGGDNGGIALKAARNAGEAVSVLHSGLMNYGDALAGLDYGAPVYADAANGVLDDSDNTGANQQVGYVQAAYGITGPTASKILRVEVG